MVNKRVGTLQSTREISICHHSYMSSNKNPMCICVAKKEHIRHAFCIQTHKFMAFTLQVHLLKQSRKWEIQDLIKNKQGT